MEKTARKYGVRAHAGFDEKTAQKIAEELEVATAANSYHSISPEEFIEIAKSGDAPACAERLTWDDKKAGHQWRLQEARTTLNHITIIEADEEGEEVEIRAFQNLVVEVGNGEPHPERRYVPLEVIRSEEALVKQVIAEAESELRRARAKLKFYKSHIRAELKRIVDVIDEELELDSEEEGEA